MPYVSVKELEEKIEHWKRTCHELDLEIRTLNKERDHYKQLAETYHNLLLKLGG